MSNDNHRYPEGTAATLADFERSGWREVAEGKPGRGAIRWQTFSQAAEAAITEGDAPKARVLWLLADVTSPMLKPNSTNAPFAPLAMMGDRRSCVPDDLSASDLTLLQEILPSVDEPELKARIADILWMRVLPRNADYTRTAIAAYTAGGLKASDWDIGRSDGWHRAFTLALQVKAQAQVTELSSSVEQAVLLATEAEGRFARSLARLLETKRIWSDAPKAIADKLAQYGEAHQARCEPSLSRMYFDTAASWYARARDVERQADMTCAVAASWAEEAEQRLSALHAGNIVASSFYEDAIQAYRGVPKKQRASRNVDERIAELSKLLTSTGKASLDEMGRVETGRTNITDLVERSVASVRGKSKLEALLALAQQASAPDLASMVKFAEQQAREFPFQYLFGSTHYSRDGRVIAKRPAADLGAQPGGKDDPMVWSILMQHFGINMGLVVQGQVIHALGTLLQEHQVTEGECCDMVAAAGLVEPDRVYVVGKALFAGFEQDFLAALHLLVPQVEAMVRLHLKRFGGKTTTLSLEGIETENGLSTLVELPQMHEAFGDNLTFELKAVFCDPLGPNLRNELAHGLLDSNVGNTPAAVYAWWFMFRMVFSALWQRQFATGAASASTEQAASEEPSPE